MLRNNVGQKLICLFLTLHKVKIAIRSNLSIRVDWKGVVPWLINSLNSLFSVTAVFTCGWSSNLQSAKVICVPRWRIHLTAKVAWLGYNLFLLWLYLFVDNLPTDNGLSCNGLWIIGLETSTNHSLQRVVPS